MNFRNTQIRVRENCIDRENAIKKLIFCVTDKKVQSSIKKTAKVSLTNLLFLNHKSNDFLFAISMMCLVLLMGVWLELQV